MDVEIAPSNINNVRLKLKRRTTSAAALWGRSVAPMSGHVCRPAEKTRCE
ncbi:hypothetical protein ACFZB5_32115 [Streptomyces nodosus]